MAYSVKELEVMLKEARAEAKGKNAPEDIERAHKALEILSECKQTPSMKVIVNRLVMYTNNEHYTRNKA